MVKHDTLLICSSIPENRQELRRVFSDSFHLLEARDGRQLALLLQQNIGCIAAVLLDVSDWKKEDTQYVTEKKNQLVMHQIPVIILARQDTPALLNRAFGLGASDVIPIGYDPYAMLHRVETIIDLHLHKQHLETLVEEQRQVLRHSSDAMVDALSAIIEYRSVESGQHIQRIRRLTRVLLEEVARCCPEYLLTGESIDKICSASALHDIGKIAIPDNILMKPGKLTEEEWQIMKTHAVTGCRIIESLEHMADKEYLKYAHDICHYHHERWDGRGYPEGLMGDAIPICAQVVSLTDAYDALTSRRVYKEAYDFSRAVNMIYRGECGVFSPRILDCFKNVVHQFAELSEEYADGKPPEIPDADVRLPEKLQTADTLEWIGGKYYTLVHYLNGFLMELDLDRKLFHLVYNPYPELSFLQEVTTLEEIREQLCGSFIHPQDRDKMQWFLDKELGRFLKEGLRRLTRRFRLTGADGTRQMLFELTLLRINPLERSRRSMMVLARKLLPEGGGLQEDPGAFVPPEGTLNCKNDADFTLLQLGPSTHRLAGYTQQELQEKFGGRLLELVHPDDRELVRRGFTRQLQKGTGVRLEYRLLQKNGSVRWVYNISFLMTDASGEEVLSTYLVDTQDLHRGDKLIHEKLQRYEKILGQTENVLFEWDIVRDTIYFSEGWEKVFGYPAPRDGEGWSRQWEAYLNPDDIPLVEDCVRNLKNGSAYEMTQVRFFTGWGRYLWCRFRATPIRDEKGTLQKIIGIIINIDAEKKAEQALQSKADQDPLTKLLNKGAARKQAAGYFDRHSTGALLICDLDDFKTVNDRLGHLFGDTVLTMVARELREQFRDQDIVARIGGDEFMVVMRGSVDQDLLERRCHLLLQNLANTFRSYQVNLSCSIGIALAPVHGKSYYELFRHADQALYRVKSRGKNAFAIYNPADSGYLNQPGRTSTVSNPIDSDTQPGIANDNIVRYAFQKLYSSHNVKESINELLAFIGEKTNVSRVYVFENSEDDRFCSNTYEWCSQGIQSQMEKLQNISYETDIPGYADNFNEQGIFYCPDVSILPRNIYDIVAPQGIRAMLHCAIRDNGVFRGYIGFDDCREPRIWTREQIELLTFFSEALSMFLLRRRRQAKLRRQAEERRLILDNQDAWIYVVDPECYGLLYINSSLREAKGQSIPGMTCYRVLEERDTPCEHCPLDQLSGRKNHTCLLAGKDRQKPILLEAAKIQWDGKDACLISGRRLPEETV